MRKSLKTTLILGLVFIALVAWYVLSGVLGAADGPLRGAAAVQQLNGSNADFVVAIIMGPSRMTVASPSLATFLEFDYSPNRLSIAAACGL